MFAGTEYNDSVTVLSDSIQAPPREILDPPLKTVFYSISTSFNYGHLFKGLHFTKHKVSFLAFVGERVNKANLAKTSFVKTIAIYDMPLEICNELLDVLW